MVQGQWYRVVVAWDRRNGSLSLNGYSLKRLHHKERERVVGSGGRQKIEKNSRKKSRQSRG
ncbi:MAG: hypothetical protein WCP60_02990 [bacterium]